MFHFPGFPTYTYVFSIRYTVLRRVCSHIRKSADITLICSSPQLIAACHVLHRLLMPRHSPYALLCLNFRSRPSRGARCSLELLESYKRFRFHITRIKRFSFSFLRGSHRCEPVSPLDETVVFLPSISGKTFDLLTNAHASVCRSLVFFLTICSFQYSFSCFLSSSLFGFQ